MSTSRFSRLREKIWLPGRQEFMVLLSLIMLAGGLWAFVKLADEVLEGETQTFDEVILLSMREPGDRSDPIGPGWLEEMGRDFTALGGMAVLSLLSLAAIGYLLMEHKRRIAALLFVSVGGGWLISMLLKSSFDRPRPDLVPHDSIVYTTSFPSGHSMMAAVTYLTLAALLARVQKRRRVKGYLMLLAVLLIVCVGVSRIYVGVHWPTDVLAGWTAGAIWALACWEVARWLQHRGRIEQEGVEPELEDDGKKSLGNGGQ